MTAADLARLVDRLRREQTPTAAADVSAALDAAAIDDGIDYWTWDMATRVVDAFDAWQAAQNAWVRR